MLVISAHADTGFNNHTLNILSDDIYFGHLDNFVGVYAVMKAYFSGRLNRSDIRICLTYGEEENFEGAYEAVEVLTDQDVVLVIDITGTRTTKDFVIEKCKSKKMQEFLNKHLNGLSFDLYEGCPDPIADEDEVDVYLERCTEVCFIGIPCYGGDYNDEEVYCKIRSVDSVAECISRLVEGFTQYYYS